MVNDAKDIMWLGLTVFLVLAGGGIAYALWRTGRTLRGVEQDLHRTVDKFVPVIAHAAVTVDTINSQLGKVDLMLDSAVDITESVDTTVRAVSHAITEPVKKVSGVVAGAGEAVSSFRDRMRDGEAGSRPAADETTDQASDTHEPYPEDYRSSSYAQGYPTFDAAVDDAAAASEDYP